MCLGRFVVGSKLFRPHLMLSGFEMFEYLLVIFKSIGGCRRLFVCLCLLSFVWAGFGSSYIKYTSTLVSTLVVTAVNE